MRIPDPRRYGIPAPENEFLRFIDGDDARGVAARNEWLQRLREGLKRGRDQAIFDVLRQAPSPSAHRALWESVCFAAERPENDEQPTAIATRSFALPIVLVTAARQKLIVPGVLSGIEEIRALLERHGALGASRNFGLTNAWCGLDAIESVKPSRVYAWSREGATESMEREIAPLEMRINPGREQIHLRFLVGASIAPREAPSFLETASNIGAWGRPLTAVLARQLAQPGLDLLSVPRPPVSLLRAAHAGRSAQLELALNLFVSNTLREFRSAVGEPVVMVSAHRLAKDAGELRVSMSSILDDTLLEGFRWPLHPLDDIERIAGVIDELLRDCRVSDVRGVDAVLPDRLESGARFLKAMP